jgi:hypothetical protein
MARWCQRHATAGVSYEPAEEQRLKQIPSQQALLHHKRSDTGLLAAQTKDYEAVCARAQPCAFKPHPDLAARCGCALIRQGTYAVGALSQVTKGSLGAKLTAWN